MDGINSIPYIKGSTDTAYGMAVALDELFIKSKGDRPKVDDIMIVLTDGGSDLPEKTVTEAQRVKASGIRCV